MTKVDAAIDLLLRGWWNADRLSDEPDCRRASGNGLVRDAKRKALADGLYWHEMWVDYAESGDGTDHKLFTITAYRLTPFHRAWVNGGATVTTLPEFRLRGCVVEYVEQPTQQESLPV